MSFQKHPARTLTFSGIYCSLKEPAHLPHSRLHGKHFGIGGGGSWPRLKWRQHRHKECKTEDFSAITFWGQRIVYVEMASGLSKGLVAVTRGLCIHSYLRQIFTEHPLCARTALGTNDKSVNRKDTNPYLQRAYLLVANNKQGM